MERNQLSKKNWLVVEKYFFEAISYTKNLGPDWQDIWIHTVNKVNKAEDENIAKDKYIIIILCTLWGSISFFRFVIWLIVHLPAKSYTGCYFLNIWRVKMVYIQPFASHFKFFVRT